MEKKCPGCGETKAHSCFSKNKANKDGLDSRCKECTKHYYNAHKDERMLRELRYRAKRKGLEFDLTLEDITGVDVCPVLGISLERAVGGSALDNSPSIDRIDPSKGYVKGNVQILSKKANAMKQDATPEELIKFAQWVLKTHKT